MKKANYFICFFKFKKTNQPIQYELADSKLICELFGNFII